MTKKYYYKAMDKDMMIYEQRFELNKEYTIGDKDSTIWEYYNSLEETFGFSSNPKDRHFIVSVENNKMVVEKEITREEIEEHINFENSKQAYSFLAMYTNNVEKMKELVLNRYMNVRVALAKNENIPANLLVELFKDTYYQVRQAVAENVNTPVENLLALSNESFVYVRASAKETLRKLGIEK